MFHRQFDTCLHAHRLFSRQVAVLAATLILFAIGCQSPFVDDADDTERQSSPVTAPSVTKAASPSVTKAAAAPAPAAASSTPTVWVILKSQINPAAAARGKDWKGKGKAVFNALTANASSSQASLKRFLDGRGAKFKSFWIVNTLKVTADQQTIDEIAKRPDVARVVPDRTFSLPPLQPSSGRIATVEWGLANIRAPEVWEQFGARGDGIVVANIDTGVAFDHPALVRQYRGNPGDGTFDHNYNWFDPANICGFPSTVPCDNNAHGTHTMGTMVGDDLAGNQIGVAPAARWIAAKGCEFSSCSLDSLLSAGQWVLAPTDLNGQNPRPDLRPHIVNNSWSGGPGDPFYQPTVQAWVAAGIFPAFANSNAGPSCGSAGSPGDYPESYAVGAYDIGNNIADFSSRGPSGLDGGIKPNISAPGVDVRSSVPGGAYEFFSGTSMATPHVAGAVALLWSGAPGLVGDIEGTRAILDQTAVDASDLSCGGTPENNNVFGEGRLDVLAAMNEAPTGPSGTLEGLVTASGAAPVAHALIHAQGAADRTAVSDASGAYRLRLPVGTYSLTVSAFGFETQTISGVNIVADTTTTQDVTLVSVPSFRLSGTVLDSTGLPVVGGQVSVIGTPLAPALTDEAGHYEFPLIPAGTYDISGSALGSCYDSSTTQVTVSADTVLDFTLVLRPDGFGYVCRLTSGDYLEANTPTGLVGDDMLVTVEMPFAFPYYNSSFSSANVTTNGVVSFLPTFAVFSNVGIPDPSEPNAAVFAFWDDLFVDELSTINTDTFGVAPNRVFVVEWRNISPLGRPDLRMDFEVQLGENGSVVMLYQNVEPDPFQRGASASIGIEDEAGTTGIQFGFQQPILRNNMTIAYTLPPSGSVHGTVTDNNDGTPVPGATVRALQGTTVVRQVSTGGNGSYAMHLPVGSYTIEATATNYSVESASVNVTLNADIEVNFALGTGLAEVTPATIQLTVPVNQSRTRQLTLSNTGSASLTFTINESGGGLQTTVSTARLAKNPSFDADSRDTRTMFAPGVLASGMAPQDTGDVIKSFPPTGLGFAWGVGMTSNLWLSDIDVPFRDVEFTTDGAPTGNEFATPWVAAFGADMAYVPGLDLLCQVNVGGDNGIYCMDPSTGDVVASITGGFQWTGISQRGLAYRPDDDSFYIGGWNDGIIYHIAGLGSAVPGEVLDTCIPGDGVISGLAYNPAAEVLWAATNSPTDTIYQLNPSDCTVLSTLAHPEPGFQGGGLEMDEQGNLWMIAQSPNRVFLVESGVPAFSDVPWLSVSPTTGTVAPGAQTTLNVTIDTSGLTPGLYLATVFVQTTAARQPSIRVPVSLYIADYQQSVNAGGSAYVDTLGDVWAADQRHTNGSWGYVQKSKTDSTNRTIFGTPDQPLFRTQRIDPYGYRFDNVPNGTYQIELRFAELNSRERIGQRLFDVIAEDSLLLPAHDIVYEVGTLAAESRTFFLNVTDGRMDIRLIPRHGSDSPVINAARVTHRTDR
jgi:subtilisin family serine protease